MNKRFFLSLMFTAAMTPMLHAQRFMDTIDRGLIAIKQSSGVYLSWRILGTEYYGVDYNVYRDGTKINATPLSVSNFTDTGGTTSSTYTVVPVVYGKEDKAQTSAVASVWSHSYLTIPKAHRTSNDGTTDITNNYEPNDATIADVDGDGQMEILVKEICTSDKVTTADIDFDRIEVYKLDGTLLWWIDCGPNLWDFQHNETNIAAYDWDMDGKAECIMRVADGTKIHAADGTVYTIGDPSKNERSAIGAASTNGESFIHTGAEYLVYLNGATGKPYEIGSGSTPYYIDYPLKRLEAGETDLSKAWGDGYGHRSTKHFFGAPYLDGKKPSIFMARGIYTRHKMIALDVDPATHKLTQRWRWNCNTPGSPWYGQGYHNYTIADVDWDGRDEICFGSMVIDDNGKGLSTTGLGHGDAQHWGDFDPYKHGQEVYACNETSPSNNYRDATTSKIYYRLAGGSDDGRSMCGNFTNEVPGAIGFSGHDSFISCVAAAHTSAIKSNYGVSQNFRIYWDGDLLEETFNGTALRNSNGAIYKYGKGAIQTFDNTYTNNDTKATPCMQADIFGDWREEVILRDGDNNMRIETTTTPTKWRNYTLLHDPQYRNAMVWQMNGYNQPPHVSYFLGEMEGITMAPPAPMSNGKVEIAAGGTISSATNGQYVLADATADATYQVADGAAPAIFFDNAPSWVQGHDNNNNITYTYYTHTLTGGAFGGSMRLVKQGDGALTLPNVKQTYTGSTDVWAGTVNFDGEMTNSRVWLNRFAVLNSNGGKFPKGIQADYGASVRPGGEKNVGTLTTDSLIMNFGSILDIDVKADGTADQVTANVLKLEKKDWKVGPQYLEPRLNVNSLSSELKAGTYTIATVGKIEGSLDDVKITGLNGRKANLSYVDGKVVLTIADLRDATKVTWTGSEDANWDFANTNNFTNGSTNEADVFVSGDSVYFEDGAAQTNVKLTETVRPSKIVFNNNEQNYTLSGDSIAGNTIIEKNGTGKVTLNNVSSFRGSTTVNAGTLVVKNLGQSSGVNNGALGFYTNRLTLNNGTLQPSATMTGGHPVSLGANGGTINTPGGVTLTLQGAITGSGNTLTKTGAGTLQLSSSASYGSLIVNAGEVRGSENSNSVHAYPSKIILNGGTLRDADGMFSYSNNYANVQVPEGATASWYLDSRCDYRGTLTGAGTLNLYATNIRTKLDGNWSNFAGTINIGAHKTGSYTPSLTLNNGYGLKNATVRVGADFNNNGYNCTIGNLTGSSTLSGSGTWIIGYLDQDVTYSGTINGGKITKVGEGTWTLSALQTKLGGDVTVSGGVLKLNSPLKSSLFFGNRSVIVSGAGTLMGEAYLHNISVKSGGTLDPGKSVASIRSGSLKSDGSVSCEAGSTTKFNLRINSGTASSTSIEAKSLALNGDLVVSMLSMYVNKAKAGDTFTLWTVNTFSGTPTSVTLPELPDGLEWNTDSLFLPTGVLKVQAATGIRNLAADATFTGDVYTVNGIKVGTVTTTKNGIAQAIKKLTSMPGIYVVRVNGDAMKVVVK